MLAPLIGMVLGFALMASITWIFRKWNPFRLDKLFRRLQLLSAGLYSLGHGGNDAQKTMGIITGLLVASGHLQKFEVPLWVILISHAAIAFGTMFGGWRIVKTMGSKITKLQPFGGFCAETSGAITLVGRDPRRASRSRPPTRSPARSSGVGATKRLSAVKWGVAGRIVWAWVLTIPLAAAMSAVSYFVLRRLLLGAPPPGPTFFSASRFESGLSSFSCSRTYRRISPGSVQAYCRSAQPMALRRKNSFEAEGGLDRGVEQLEVGRPS